MDLKELNKPLAIKDVDFRIQSINGGGYATILAYKDARVDMNRLDAVVGCLNWKREHIVIDGSMYCRVSILNKETGEWIYKEDVGTESMADKEKGLASDSFKRACFNWGIGRELYDYPKISISLNKDEYEAKNGKNYATWKLDIKAWVWSAEFDTNNTIVSLSAVDNYGKNRFNWNAKSGTAKIEAPKIEQPITETEKSKELPPFPPAQYETLARALFEQKTTLDIEKAKYTFSEAAQKVIKSHYKNLIEKKKEHELNLKAASGQKHYEKEFEPDIYT